MPKCVLCMTWIRPHFPFEQFMKNSIEQYITTCLFCGSSAVEQCLNGILCNHTAFIGDSARCFDCKAEFVVTTKNMMVEEERQHRWPVKVAIENGEFDGDENSCVLCGNAYDNDTLSWTHPPCRNFSTSSIRQLEEKAS